MSVRGRPQEREVSGRTVRLYPICHPAAALRSDNVRRQLRDDFHRLPELLAEPRPEPARAEPLDLPAGSRPVPAAGTGAGAGPDAGGGSGPPDPAAQLDLFA